jgi:hypothetical protein
MKLAWNVPMDRFVGRFCRLELDQEDVSHRALELDEEAGVALLASVDEHDQTIPAPGSRYGLLTETHHGEVRITPRGDIPHPQRAAFRAAWELKGGQPLP